MKIIVKDDSKVETKKEVIERAKRERRPLTRVQFDKLLARYPKRTVEVTDALIRLGVDDVELVHNRAHAYFYFSGPGVSVDWKETSVYTPHLYDQTIREWIKDFENLSGRRVLDEERP